MNQYHFNKINQLKDWKSDLNAVLVFANVDEETRKETIRYISLLDYAIDQIERAQKNAQDLEDMDRQLYKEQQQNQRYREVIEDIKNTWNVTNTYQEYMDAIHDIIADLEESK